LLSPRTETGTSIHKASFAPTEPIGPIRVTQDLLGPPSHFKIGERRNRKRMPPARAGAADVRHHGAKADWGVSLARPWRHSETALARQRFGTAHRDRRGRRFACRSAMTSAGDSESTEHSKPCS
jgi:hypothetical protein